MSSLTLGVADYLVIGVMLAISSAIGLYFRFSGNRQRTTAEYLLAGKNMGILPVAFSLMATHMSAIAVLGVPAETYMYGTQFIMWLVGMPVGIALAAYIFLPVFLEMEIASVYEYLERRFGKITRTIVSGLFAVQMILFMAVVLYAPAMAFNAVTGLSTWGSIITLGCVCTLYSSLGGLKAVLWTDVFQSMLMYLTIISIGVKTCIDVGGVKKLWSIAEEGGRLIFFNFNFDMTERYTFWNSIFAGTFIAVGCFGTNQTQIQRLMSVGSLKKAQLALWVSLPLTAIFLICCTWNGVAIYALFHDCDPILSSSNTILTKPDQFVPYAILTMFNYIPGFCGLCIAGVFSASLSTVSSAVNSLAAVTIEDFVRPFCSCKELSDSTLSFLAKIIVIGYGILCLLLTFVVSRFRGVLEASNILSGMVGGPVLGAFALGFLTIRTNEIGLLVGLSVGFALSTWLGLGSYMYRPIVRSLARSIEGCSDWTNSTLSLIPNEKDETVFYLYGVSYLWFPMFGMLAVIIVGYISSTIVSCFKESAQVDYKLISPVFRRWLYKNPKKPNIIYL